MVSFAFEPGLKGHFPDGLWPVGVLGGLAVALAAFVLVMLAVGAKDRIGRGLPVAAIALALAALAVYVYADRRYHDCLEGGNHPWWTDHVDPGKHICDRAVFGDTRVDPR